MFTGDDAGQMLTISQYNELLKLIWKEHRFGFGGKHIKYIRPSFDTRTGTIFNVFFDRREFDYRFSQRSMYECILEWLDSR